MDVFFEAAKAFATKRHDGHTRHDGKTPYITHPVRVAERLREAGVMKAEILAAALLHDVVEKTPTTPDDIVARFGPRVGALVEEVSRPPGMTSEDFIERVATSSARSLLIRVADRLDNLEDPSGLEPSVRPTYAEDALTLAAAALTNPRLDRLFSTERRALNQLLSELIDAARTELLRAPKGRGRTALVAPTTPQVP